MRLRGSFNSRFHEGFTIHIRKTRTLGIRLLTTSARLYFRRSLGPPQEEKERGLISRTAASNGGEICFCMYSTAFASISSTALEIEALSFAVNRFRKKTKEHSEPIYGVTPGEILFRIESHVFASEEYECKWRWNSRELKQYVSQSVFWLNLYSARLCCILFLIDQVGRSVAWRH